MRLRPAGLFVLLATLPGCAEQGVYMMWNPYDQQRVECDKNEGSHVADGRSPGLDRLIPYTCIAACLQAGFEGNDPSLEREIAHKNFTMLMRLADSEVPPLCRSEP
jgi:hypothetical protein